MIVGGIVAIASILFNVFSQTWKFTIFILAGIGGIFYGLNNFRQEKIHEHLNTSAVRQQQPLTLEQRKELRRKEAEKYLMSKTDLKPNPNQQSAQNQQNRGPQQTLYPNNQQNLANIPRQNSFNNSNQSQNHVSKPQQMPMLNKEGKYLLDEEVQGPTESQFQSPSPKNEEPFQQPSQRSLKFCFNCGTHVLSHDHFCTNCGSKLR